MQRQHLSISVAVLTALLLVSPAFAAMTHLESLQSAQGSLEFQYAFEGAADATRLADGSSNGYTLQELDGSEGSAGGVTYVAGFDGSSQAYHPASDPSNYRIGDGLNTISTSVNISQTVTIEAVVQFDEYLTTTGTVSAYILSARPQPNNQRAYFLRQGDSTVSGDRLFTTLGNTFGDQLDIIDPYTAGEWYYIAMVADITGANSDVTVYGANLSQGETTLSTLVSDNSLFQGDWSGAAQVGVGNFLNGTQEYFQGAIDNIALFNSKLPASALQEHLDAIYQPIPEPASLALMGLGCLWSVARRR